MPMMRVLITFAAAALMSIPAAAQGVTLKTISKIFIEKMSNDFDNDLRVQITRQFRGRVNVVLDRDAADAILVGVSKEDKSSNTRATLRYLGLDTVSAGTLTLIDKSGKIILWTDEAGDRAPWLSSGGIAPNAQKTIAERLIRKMKKAIDTALK